MYFFFTNALSTTAIYTLSLHDALPIYHRNRDGLAAAPYVSSGSLERYGGIGELQLYDFTRDRKSTRLNSSHRCISYAVFCLKKKRKKRDGEVREGREVD